MGKRMRDENMERSPQEEPKRSSRIAGNQVYIYFKYINQKRQTKIH